MFVLMSTDKAQLVRYHRDMGREMTKMADAASLDCLSYLLSLVVLEAETLNASGIPADGEDSRSRD